MSFQSVALSFQSVLLCGRTAWRGFQTSDKRSKKKKKGVKEVFQFYIYKLPIDRPWRLLLVIYYSYPYKGTIIQTQRSLESGSDQKPAADTKSHSSAMP